LGPALISPAAPAGAAHVSAAATTRAATRKRRAICKLCFELICPDAETT
jgi:hypothetical protein